MRRIGRGRRGEQSELRRQGGVTNQGEGTQQRRSGTRPHDAREEQRDESAHNSMYDSAYDSAYDPSYSAYGSSAHGAGLDSGAVGAIDASYALDALPAERALVAQGAMSTRAIVPRDDDDTPVFVPGSGRSMGNPFIRRRQRPLSMRLILIILVACLVATGLFTVTPLGSSAGGSVTTFQQLAGSVVLNQQVGYQWYVTQPGDTPESIAAKFGVTVGGIYELNELVVGQDLAVGVPLKVSRDPKYGADYQAPSITLPGSGNDATTFGSDWWNSNAGTPLPDQPCSPDGGGDPLGYKLQSPVPGSNWVRGFSWYHNGVDIAGPNGTPILAAQAGVVIWSGWTNTGFGYSVVVSHCYHLETLYGHMSALSVHAGEFVRAGQQVGLEGATGWATGPHLHLSILVNGQFVNPMRYYESVYTLTH